FTAKCSPQCQNSGQCVNPNECECTAGYAGDICAGIAACSHLSPCYPGRCYGSNQCLCSEGFEGSTCKTCGEYEVNKERFTCSQPSDHNPIANKVLECRMNNGTNVFQVDSGDSWKRIYQRYVNSVYKVPFQMEEDITKLEEDITKLEEDITKLEEYITKGSIRPKWSGWSDRDLSGVKQYAFEVWKMEYSFDYSVLREPDILPNYNPVPEFITEVLASNNTFPEYEPKGPGVYSTILEVADRANNSRYVRRIAIFDKTSEISTKSNHRLFVSSASNQSNYSWQTTPNNLQTTTLIVQWENHFINEVHENGHFLARVQDYTPRLSDNVKRVNYKEIESQFDDNEGSRTKDEIPNINSIVQFEISHGTPSTVAPINGWEDIVPLKENQSIVLSGVNIRDGDSHQVWIRAYDVMGNEKVDSTVVHFDHSQPILYDPMIKKNVDDEQFPFSSRVTVATKDEHSGISKVSIKFVVNRTGEVKNQKDFQIVSQPQQLCDQLLKECYCIPTGECFLIDIVQDINNCWLRFPIDEIEDEVYTLQIAVYNLAMLSSMTTYNLGNATSFSGIKVYYGVSNLQIEVLSDTSFEVTWEQSKSCYERLGMKLMVTNEDGLSKEHDVYKNATSYTVRNLKAPSTYIINMFTKYGTDEYFVMSEPVNATINLVLSDR
ncbi:uncharacterized protein LOC127727811, partial [Mytilus californianus]|uniref:uncharacterized protein LOC127727811 n=1 Tax=Mytilus californianus TaxID=6549 RepID=UPI00224758A2